MVKQTILVVDDDPRIRSLVASNLIKRDYAVYEAVDGEAAIAYLESNTPELVILDLVLPGVSGNDVCIWIRRQALDIPILVLSAHDEEDLKVRALDSGADDYVTKPFNTEEFLARLRALMRRSSSETSETSKIQIEGLTIDLKGRRAFVDNADMHLTRTEFALLATLAKSCDAVLTHDELLARVWGQEYRGSSHYLHVYLGRLRKKMSDKYSALLETISGMGYILHSQMPVAPSSEFESE
jgi:DNA-binding response OmpR family regulator